MNKLQKVIKTVFLVLVWVCLGLFLEITGPTLIDLKIRTQADYEQVAVAVSGRSAGYFIGSAIGGVLVDKFGAFCDLMIGVSLTGGAVATVFVPFSPVVELLWFIIVVQGTFEGVINIAGQKLILNLWKEDAASPLHILHGGFGIGSFIIPLIANPFLAIPKPRNSPTIQLNDTFINHHNTSETNVSTIYDIEGSNNITQFNKTDGLPTGTDKIEYLRESRIEIAYLISALITLALSSVFYTYHLRGQRKRKANTPTESDTKRGPDVLKSSTNRSRQVLEGFKKMINPATCSGGRFLYGVQIFGLLFLFFVNIVGGERILGKFIRAFSIEQLGFSVSKGTYLNTVFWISFAVGRISGFIVARYVPIRILILIETGGVLVSTILLNIFAPTNATALWVLTIATGLFHAPGFPSGIGWGDYHVEMTGMAITVLLLGGSIGGIVYLKLTGFLFETYGARSFLYHVMGYGIASFSFAILLNLVGAQHGNRFQWAEREAETQAMQDTEMEEREKMVDRGK